MRRLVVALRGLAILLAVVGVIDPAITSRRSAKPIVSLLLAPNVDPALGSRLAASLANSYTVLSAPFANSRAIVLVGNAVPRPLDITTPVFAVAPDLRGPMVAIDGVNAPAASSIEAPVVITPTVEVDGAVGRTVDVSLMLNGRVIDRATHVAGHDTDRSPVSLTFTPATLGMTALRVVATVHGSAALATADIAVDIVDAPWSVLFFDRRPSWMSTFVRRAIAGDRRFAVSSRITTSTGVSTTTGHPPLTLDDSASVERYAAIVVGAPDDLTGPDVSGLDRFLRRRGGSVVLLVDDQATTSRSIDELSHVGRWMASTSDTPVTVNSVASDSMTLRAAEFLWPAVLPIGGLAIGRDPQHRPVVWRLAVGAGQLTVSGALDAWRYRDSVTSGFDRYWRTTIADAAADASSAVQIEISNRVVAPGSSFEVRATSRSAALGSVGRITQAAVSASLVDARGAKQPIRLWPTAEPGQFQGAVRAPSTSGDYRIRVADGFASADLPIVVASDARAATGLDPDILDAYVRSHGGRVVPGDRLAELTAALASSIHGERISTRWYPLRSGWWIVPLVLLLGAEWWWRRRHGLR